MFGIGISEILIILVIALIVFGPNKLPDLAKSLGKGLAEFKKVKDDFEGSLKHDLTMDEENSYPKVESAPSEITGVNPLPQSEGDALSSTDTADRANPNIDSPTEATDPTLASQLAEKKDIKQTDSTQEAPRGSGYAG